MIKKKKPWKIALLFLVVATVMGTTIGIHKIVWKRKISQAMYETSKNLENIYSNKIDNLELELFVDEFIDTMAKRAFLEIKTQKDDKLSKCKNKVIAEIYDTMKDLFSKKEDITFKIVEDDNKVITLNKTPINVEFKKNKVKKIVVIDVKRRKSAIDEENAIVEITANDISDNDSIIKNTITIPTNIDKKNTLKQIKEFINSKKFLDDWDVEIENWDPNDIEGTITFDVLLKKSLFRTISHTISYPSGSFNIGTTEQELLDSAKTFLDNINNKILIVDIDTTSINSKESTINEIKKIMGIDWGKYNLLINDPATLNLELKEKNIKIAITIKGSNTKKETIIGYKVKRRKTKSEKETLIQMNEIATWHTIFENKVWNWHKKTVTEYYDFYEKLNNLKALGSPYQKYLEYPNNKIIPKGLNLHIKDLEKSIVGGYIIITMYLTNKERTLTSKDFKATIFGLIKK